MHKESIQRYRIPNSRTRAIAFRKVFGRLLGGIPETRVAKVSAVSFIDAASPQQ